LLTDSSNAFDASTSRKLVLIRSTERGGAVSGPERIGCDPNHFGQVRLNANMRLSYGTAEPPLKKKLSLLGCATLLITAAGVYANLQVRATAGERSRPLPGDDLIARPIGSVDHAITIKRPPRDVWPWLVQMGSGRAGWYSYDFIDNGGHPSSQRILPQYQSVGVGTVFPALPGAKDAFVVAECDPEHSLVLAWRQPDGIYQTTWAFVLEQPQKDQTRLIVRGRVASRYHPFGLPEWVALSVGRVAHFVMERKQLLNIASRAEKSTADRGYPVGAP